MFGRDVPFTTSSQNADRVGEEVRVGESKARSTHTNSKERT